MHCTTCQFESPDEARFCMQCGRPLTATAPEQEAERRQLTVMFCDLVGSTSLSERLDAEEFRELVGSYQYAAGEVIQSHGGYVAQYLGDGILVYFGYPVAHEDDAQRSARAGLGIIEAMQALSARRARGGDVQLEVRIGIHTGVVVVGRVGHMGRSEELAMGETPNVAARLQGLAKPNEVVISAVTRRILGEGFLFEDLGRHALKGIEEPVSVHRLTGARAEGEHAYGPASGRALTALVGRRTEEAQLRRCWQSTLEGKGQIVCLNGEAGIGKSRLVALVRAIAAEGPHSRFEAQGADHLRYAALQPIVEMIKRMLRIERNEAPDRTLEKLEYGLASVSIDPDEAVPLLADFLSVPVPSERYPPLGVTPARRKQRTLETIAAVVGEFAARRPTLFVLEDLHWLDPSTLEFVEPLLAQTESRGLMVVLTYRPDFTPPWQPRSNQATLELRRIGAEEIQRMVREVAGDQPLPAAVVDQIAEKTDGVPLFVEELTRTILESLPASGSVEGESRAEALAALAIPATLQDSLMARLDSLADAKGVAQLCAILGRSFPLALLRAVFSGDETDLERDLAALEAANLIFHEPGGTEPRYVFKHALVRDVAYQSLLRRPRLAYHQRVAEALRSGFPELVATQPELLAHHFAEAGQSAEAYPYFQRSGQRALERSANLEASALFSRGLECLEDLPDGPERKLAEAALRTGLAVSLQTRGLGAPELGPLYDRARVLCEELGDTPQLFPVLRGMFLFYGIRAEIETSQQIARQLVSLAERAQEPALLLEARRTLGYSLWENGEFEAALEQLEKGLALYDPAVHGTHASRFGGIDPGLACLTWRGLLLGWLGRIAEAEESFDRSIELAEELRQPMGLCTALHWAGAHHQLRGDVERTRACAERSRQVAADAGIPWVAAMAQILLGWVQAAEGHADEGLKDIRTGLAMYRATGALVPVPYFLAQLADACLRTGRIEAGLAAVHEALDQVEKTGEWCWKAELTRLHGELLLAQEVPDASAAERAFADALATARDQGANVWRLRAALALGRLWQEAGRSGEASRVVTEAMDGIRDGSEIAEFSAARAQLAAADAPGRIGA